MARPIKKGLDYFPMDVDFTRDIKVRRIINACGKESVYILHVLLASIYREDGYYLTWDDDIAFLVADEVGTKEGTVNELINKAIQVGFFNKDLYDKFKILTSKGIQNRYIAATGERKKVELEKDYLLTNEVNRSNISIVHGTNLVNHRHSTQSKVKESKGKKSKVNNTVKDEQPSQSFDEFNLYSFVEQNFNRVLSPIEIETLGHWLKEYNIDLIKEAIKRTVLKNKYTIGYVEGILRNWEKNNVTTLGMVQEQDEKWNQQRSNYSKKPTRKETVPEVFTEKRKETPISAEEQAELEAQIRQFTGG